SRRRHTRFSRDWSSDVCSSDLEIEAHLAEILPALVETRRDLHRNPEIGFKEFRTAEIVARHLRELGLEVEEGIGGTGVVGTLREIGRASCRGRGWAAGVVGALR